MCTAGWASSRRAIYMCGSSSASQKRRNGHNARLKTTSCGRHDVRGRWRRSVDDPHPKPLRPVPPAQSRAFCYAQTDRPYREGPSTCAVCRQHASNAETAATPASKAAATPSSSVPLFLPFSSCSRRPPRPWRARRAENVSSCQQGAWQKEEVDTFN